MSASATTTTTATAASTRGHRQSIYYGNIRQVRFSIQTFFAIPIEIIRDLFTWVSFKDIMKFDSAITNYSLRNEWKTMILPELMHIRKQTAFHNPITTSHTQPSITGIDFIHDKYILTTTTQSKKEYLLTIRIWDYQTRTLKHTFDQAYLTFPVSPDKIMIMYEGHINVYNIETGTCIHQMRFVKFALVKDVVQMSNNTVVLLIEEPTTNSFTLRVWNIEPHSIRWFALAMENAMELLRFSDELLGIRDSKSKWVAINICNLSAPQNSCQGHQNFYLINHKNRSVLLTSQFHRRLYVSFFIWDPASGQTQRVWNNNWVTAHSPGQYQFEMQLSNNQLVLLYYTKKNEEQYLVTAKIGNGRIEVSAMIPLPQKYLEFSCHCELSNNRLVSFCQKKNFFLIWNFQTKTVETVKCEFPVENCVSLSNDTVITNSQSETYLTIWKLSN